MRTICSNDAHRLAKRCRGFAQTMRTDYTNDKVDLFVILQIEVKEHKENLPGDINGILFDMGAQLHDPPIAPKIAENFERTPRQLLDRVRKLPY
jgi:hypothetical protein